MCGERGEAEEREEFCTHHEKHHRHHYHWHHHKHLPVRGLLHLLLLKLLDEKPLHGSEVREILKSRLNLDIPSSAIYTILSILEEKGMVISKWETAERGAARKLYSITEYGVEYLKEGVEELKRFKKILEFLTS
ncbi:MAG: helix-turn-helix transcriptional regulator [Sulfolobales archaeon]|nr:PadR family transcriptional regulator [Sulfolobales archaeon]MDW8082933.1 helix-turn-helix transcriptional regulator [Sulfolobales archaeon]